MVLCYVFTKEVIHSFTLQGLVLLFCASVDNPQSALTNHMKVGYARACADAAE